MENKEFIEIIDKSFPKGFNKMRKTLGEKKCDALDIISAILFSDAVILMKKIGVLEEFLENKNEISRMVINSILEDREKE